MTEELQTEKRLVDLEMKISHQEMTLESLHQTVYEQQKTIDLLESRMRKLSEQLDSGRGEGLDIGPADEKPPHY